MNSISAGSRLYSQARGSNFKRLGNTRDATPRVPEIMGLPAQEFMDTLALALSQGLGVLLSPTSDGGAVSVILYDGDDRYRSYASSAQEFTDAWAAVRDHTEAKMIGSTSKGPKVSVRAS